MTDKELRKLRRDDLLQILIDQQRQIDEMSESLERAEAALKDRGIAVQEAGSVAEASLRLNGVFEAAQAAADQYAGEMRSRADAALAEAEAEAEKLRRTAQDVLDSARQEAERIIAQARQGGTAAEPAGVPETEPAEPAREEPRRRGLLWRNRKA